MIKRYGFGLRAISVGHGESVRLPDIVEQADGEFVRYDDHEAVLESIGAGGVSGPITQANRQVILDGSNHIADASKMVAPEGWQPAEAAPKEEPFIGDFGHTIPLVALWSGAENKFVAASPGVDVFKGELNDAYFESTWLEAGELKRWMPLPDFGDEI